ncbi:MAG: flagellar hook basal-body protein, partial [Desulfovibrio sp.]|nr:flagellar hook basal-body protein [Desulfovibrio sp.]
MSLSANMWTSVSGLMTHGEKMNVIGNNLANVSTLGFKAQRADFSDFIYTDYGTTSGADQVGKGVGICALIGDFSQGGFENTNSATDLA